MKTCYKKGCNLYDGSANLKVKNCQVGDSNYALSCPKAIWEAPPPPKYPGWQSLIKYCTKNTTCYGCNGCVARGEGYTDYDGDYLHRCGAVNNGVTPKDPAWTPIEKAGTVFESVEEWLDSLKDIVKLRMMINDIVAEDMQTGIEYIEEEVRKPENTHMEWTIKIVSMSDRELEKQPHVNKSRWI